MDTATNPTHDAKLTSWVRSANGGRSDFPIQNLPFAIFRRAGTNEDWRGGVAIGDQILDMATAVQVGAFHGAAQAAAQAATESSLNHLMDLGQEANTALRDALSRALRADSRERELLQDCLVPQAEAEYGIAARVGDYTDFYTSIHHATHVGTLFRPDNPLMPNYKWIPIGYHGRSSSVVVSGTPVRRPRGQTKGPDDAAPALRASQRLDMELEMGVFVGHGNALGDSIAIDQASEHVFGLVLLNDWSARDIQSWEYRPLGPFLAKNFATTISPWVVTLDALAPFRTSCDRPDGDPQPLSYLGNSTDQASGALDIQLEILLLTPAMRQAHTPPARLALTNYRHAYWTLAQMVAHHTINGCNLRSGDLLGTGTLSGPEAGQAGAMIEMTMGGKNPIELPNGERRSWLEDGDTVILRGWCEKPGYARIGFGECSGVIAAPG